MTVCRESDESTRYLFPGAYAINARRQDADTHTELPPLGGDPRPNRPVQCKEMRI